MRTTVRADRLRLIAIAMAVAIVTPLTLSAQYFGRNKVQYETFSFRILRTPNFDVHFYPEEEDPVRDAGRMLERWRARQVLLLRHALKRVPVILYASHPDFQQTNVIGGQLTEGTGGVTESGRNRIILPLTGVYADNDHVLGHELVHAFQYEIAASTPGGMQGMSSVPLWLIEGMAEYLSLGREDAHTAMWMRDAVQRDRLPTIRQLTTDPRFFPYRYGQALWAYIGGRWGDRIIPTLYRASLQRGFESALRTVLGVSADSLSVEWHRSLRDAYLPALEGRTRPDSAGTRLIAEADEGAMNISPVASPDGKYVAFFGRRGLFSVDLYLADAATGEVIRQLASPVNSPHVDAISFIASAGAWSPDSRKFAFIVFAEGDNEIHILDVESRDVERQFHPQGIESVSQLTWSPDGATLAFSGMAGGVSDLWLMDVASGNLRRLTNDKFADIHPAWAPDGRSIIFATDRGEGSNLEQLVFSRMKLATIDVATGTTREIDVFENAKHINPQFSPDGREVYFISDPDGFSDIYRLDLASGAVFRVTRLVTGVSGITYLSPALSVTASSGRLVFSVFERAGTNIYALDASQARGQPANLEMPISRLSVLPPLDPVDVFVSAYLRDATTGLADPSTFAVVPYRSRLALDYIGQPTLGVGGSSYGAMLGGSVSAYFGEMLGNRTVGVALQGYGELADFGGQAFYLNTERRWNWAVSGGHLPYLTGFTEVFQEGSAPNRRLVYQQFRRRTFYDDLSLSTRYPFSQTRRFELSLGGTRIGYSTEVWRVIEHEQGGFEEQRFDTASPPALAYGQAAAALVGDNSFFGFTSPIQGGRFRFEAGPTFGGLNFTTLLGDARRYVFVRPFTLAFRGLTYGRYGSGSEDRRLSDLWVGQPTLVRGYDPNSFTINECTQGPNNECLEFERIVGSRIAVANVEFRIPLLGNEQLGIFPIGFLPVEVAPFFDVGTAWTRNESPDFRYDRETADRVPVMSAGVATRINVLGYLVAEIFWVNPLHRPEKGSHWGFQLQPGW